MGGLVGYSMYSTIDNTSSTGAVSGVNQIGGLVGTMSYTMITSAYSTGSVSGNSIVGGLVGLNNNGTIYTAYSTGAVTGTGSNVGGLVATNQDGTIGYAYSTGAVSGVDNVGGLVGQSRYGTIDNTYSVGAVTGTGSSVGGLVGDDHNGRNTSCYWDKQTSHPSSSAGGTGLTTAQMKNDVNYVGFDFSDSSGDWLVPNPLFNSGYPTLQKLPIAQDKNGGGGAVSNDTQIQVPLEMISVIKRFNPPLNFRKQFKNVIWESVGKTISGVADIDSPLEAIAATAMSDSDKDEGYALFLRYQELTVPLLLQFKKKHYEQSEPVNSSLSL